MLYELIQPMYTINKLTGRLLVLMGIVFCSSLSFSQAENNPVIFEDESYKTYGTFQFDYPNETKLFWSIDFMESLYPSIEARRQDEVLAFWHYSPDVTIIIFSREAIQNPNFKRVSPFTGYKNPYDLEQ